MQTINYEVLNTLNLINPKLGQAHEKRGFNPFSQDYKISISGIKKLLELKISPCKEVLPSLVQLPLRKANTLLKLGKSRIDDLTTKIQLLTPKLQTKKIYDEICYLKICQELLHNLKLTQNSFDEVVEVLRIIRCLEPEYAKTIKNLFNEKYEEKTALNSLIKLAKTQTKKQNPIQKAQGVQKQRVQATVPPKTKAQEMEIER